MRSVTAKGYVIFIANFFGISFIRRLHYKLRAIYQVFALKKLLNSYYTSVTLLLNEI